MTRTTMARAGQAKIGGDTPVGKLPNGTGVVAAAKATGRRLLTTVDDFVSHQSRFDRQARVNLSAEAAEVTTAIYLDYVRSQVMDWTPSEIATLGTIVNNLGNSFKPLSLDLPSAVYVVKTTGQEEGRAAYTRRLDTIVLPSNMVASIDTASLFSDPLNPGVDLGPLQTTIAHECFHLFSKNNEARRCQLYELVHYKSTGNDVELPNVPWPEPTSSAMLPDLKITNPDAPRLNVYIDMEVPADPQEPEGLRMTRSLMPLLYSKAPYSGGVFFDPEQYFVWCFLAIQQKPQGRWIVVASADGRPLRYDSGPFMRQYLDLIGTNFPPTAEIFHPDEILAINFQLLAPEPDLDLIDKMRRILSLNPSNM